MKLKNSKDLDANAKQELELNVFKLNSSIYKRQLQLGPNK